MASTPTRGGSASGAGAAASPSAPAASPAPAAVGRRSVLGGDWAQRWRAGESVWVEDAERGWVAAVVTTIAAGQVHVTIAEQQPAEGTIVVVTKEASLLLRIPLEDADGYDNMDAMVDLHEAAVLHNVCHRFTRDHIYTSVGPILIALNPFRTLPIYGPEDVARYRDGNVAVLPPHCFAVAQDAYDCILRGRGDQSIVICGESGAGKTETTKLMLHFLSCVAGTEGVIRRASTAYPGVMPAGLSLAPGIEAQIMQTNPFMEAFGNAKTLRNDNSSRFGKFIKVQLDPTGRIVGAHITNYLLEKPRITAQPANERSYHIFYQLCRGLTGEQRQAAGFRIDPPHSVSDFRYLNTSGCDTLRGVDDAAELSTTLSAMAAVGMTADERSTVLRILVGILYLGNVQIAANDAGHATIDIACDELQRCCQCFQISPPAFAQALICKRIVSPGQVFLSPFDVTASSQARDAVARAIYGALFDWLVRRINQSVASPPSGVASFIGVLDIFGFEDLATNGFEQLFINYANEKLQGFFNIHVFRTLQEEYRKEKIDCDLSDYPSNDECLALIESKPMGVLCLMDEQVTLGSTGSDSGFVRKLSTTHAKDPNFGVCGPSTALRGSVNDFVIRHYAGPIRYNTTGFVDRNSDRLFESLLEVLVGGTNPMLTSMMTAEHATHVQAGASSSASAASSKALRTIASRFRKQLGDLMDTMGATQPRFVRCIKTNEACLPARVQPILVLRQLRYAGVIEALRVRRSGFPNTMLFRDFCLRFLQFLPPNMANAIKAIPAPTLSRKRSSMQLLTSTIAGPAAAAATLTGQQQSSIVRVILNHHAVVRVVDSSRYQIGVTKVFLRANALRDLDMALHQFRNASATKIQTLIRAWMAFRWYERAKIAAISVHAFGRRVLGRCAYLRLLRLVHRDKRLQLMSANLQRASARRHKEFVDSTAKLSAIKATHTALLTTRDELGAPVLAPVTAVTDKIYAKVIASKAANAVLASKAKVEETLAHVSRLAATIEAEAARDMSEDAVMMDPAVPDEERDQWHLQAAKRRDARNAELTTALTAAHKLVQEHQALIQGEIRRRAEAWRIFGVAERDRELVERRRLADEEAHQRRVAADILAYQARIAKMERANMEEAEREQRAFMAAQAALWKRREAAELLAMRAVEQAQRVLESQLKQQELLAERRERTAMAAEEAYQRNLMATILRQERAREAYERGRMAVEEEQMLAFIAEQRKRRKAREAAELAAMREEERYCLFVIRETRRLELIRETKELIAMRLAEQAQRRAESSDRKHYELASARNRHDERRKQQIALMEMRREDELCRCIAMEMRRRELEAARLAAERERAAEATCRLAMAAEEAEQKRFTRELQRLWHMSQVQWRILEQQREYWERMQMERAERDTIACHLEVVRQESQRKAEALAAVYMAAEDARSRAVQLGSIAARERFANALQNRIWLIEAQAEEEPAAADQEPRSPVHHVLRPLREQLDQVQASARRILYGDDVPVAPLQLAEPEEEPQAPSTPARESSPELNGVPTPGAPVVDLDFSFTRASSPDDLPRSTSPSLADLEAPGRPPSGKVTAKSRWSTVRSRYAVLFRLNQAAKDRKGSNASVLFNDATETAVDAADTKLEVEEHVDPPSMGAGLVEPAPIDQNMELAPAPSIVGLSEVPSVLDEDVGSLDIEAPAELAQRLQRKRAQRILARAVEQARIKQQHIVLHVKPTAIGVMVTASSPVPGVSVEWTGLLCRELALALSSADQLLTAHRVRRPPWRLGGSASPAYQSPEIQPVSPVRIASPAVPSSPLRAVSPPRPPTDSLSARRAALAAEIRAASEYLPESVRTRWQ